MKGAEGFINGAPPTQARAPIGAEKAGCGTGGGSGIMHAPGPGRNYPRKYARSDIPVEVYSPRN